MIERVEEFPSLIIIRHPLVQHKLTILRDQKTETKHFKELVDEIAMLMAYEATSELSQRNGRAPTVAELVANNASNTVSVWNEPTHDSTVIWVSDDGEEELP